MKIVKMLPVAMLVALWLVSLSRPDRLTKLLR